jgi:hypothetical protein
MAKKSEQRGRVAGTAAKPRREDVTSAGVPWSKVPEWALADVEFMEGRHGPSTKPLPSLDEVPIPAILFELQFPHEERARGTKAMIDAHGAQARLNGCRPGAWMIAPYGGNRFVVTPDGTAHWCPKSLELPDSLRVDARNDLQ